MKKTGTIPLLLASLFCLLSCNSSKPDSGATDEPAVRVTLFEVTPRDVSWSDSYPGNVIALKQVEIHSEVSGYVTGLFFKEGSTVVKGQKLYEIDRRLFEAAWEEAKDNVKIAQSNLNRVQLDVDRYTSLNRQDAIAKQQLDHSLTDLENARLQLASSNEELVKAKTNFDYSLITAPFDGTIGLSQVKLGTMVIPGQTLMNTISSDDPTGVDFEIGEKELERFRMLEKRVDPGKDTLFRILTPDNTLYPYPGKLELIDRAVDPQTGTITVRLVFPNPEHALRPGMSCIAKVLNESREKQLLVPFKAVTEQMGEYFVYRVSGNKATQSKIIPGPRIGPDLLILSGIGPGDRIVVEGTGKLREGSTVTTGGDAAAVKPSKK